MNIKQLFEIAFEGICMASEKVLEIYETNQLSISYKADESPVTQADIASSDIICKILEQSGLPIICEEITEMTYLKRKSLQYFWLVDPLDGTKEFISRNGEFTINIALIENNRPILGLIAIPTQNILYFGGMDLNAYRINLSNRNNFDFETAILSADILKVSINPEKIRIVVSRSHLDEKTKTFILKLQNTYPNIETISAGSALKFCRIAEGKAEIYLRFSPTMEWDTAAGQAIVEASGAVMVSLPDYNCFQYNKPILRNGGFLVTSLPELLKH